MVTRRIAAPLFVLLSVTGCDLLVGPPRTLDPPPDQVCSPGSKRCNRGKKEECGLEGAWNAGPLCPQTCVAGECVGVAVAAGDRHTCAMIDGKVACWGLNDDRHQAGSDVPETCPSAPCVPKPTPIEIDGVSTLSSLGHHTCAVSDGKVSCWGAGAHGELGTGTWVSSTSPAEIGGIDGTVVEAKAGGGESPTIKVAHSCALTDEGAIFCWGANCAGQLGISGGDKNTCLADSSCPEGPDTDTNTPGPWRLMDIDFEPIQLSLGAAHTCALSADGHVYCWGLNFFGQLGVSASADDSGECSIQPKRVPDLENIIQISAGGLHTCALKEDRTVVCWGLSYKGIIPPGDDFDAMPPTPIPKLVDIVEVAAGHGSTACARDGAGQVFCWGDNENAEAGDIAAKARVSPGDVLSFDNAIHIAVGGNHACAFDVNHELWCWGQTGSGAVGADSPGGPSEPVKVDLP